MELVPGFLLFVQALAETMTAPTYQSLETLLVGWVFTSRRTVTQMILVAGDSAQKRFSSYHRVFSAARWSRDHAGLAVFVLIKPFCQEVVYLGIDDTLARKRGRKMFGTGMHHDPLISSRGRAITNWGHSWVVLSVIVKCPFRPGHYYALPILFRLYLNKKRAKKERRAYRARSELAVEMLRVLCNAETTNCFHMLGDSAYGGQSVLNFLPANCDLTSRVVLDARLFDAPPVRKSGTNGRSRRRGDKIPTPRQMLDGHCRRVSIDIYGRTEHARVPTTVASIPRHCSAQRRPIATRTPAAATVEGRQSVGR